MRWLLLLGSLTLTACGAQVRVESDTSWSGSISTDNTSASYDGSGNQTFDVSGRTVCWVFQKNTERGRLRAYYEATSIFGNTRGEAVTSAEYGLVSGCN